MDKYKLRVEGGPTLQEMCFTTKNNLNVHL